MKIDDEVINALNNFYSHLMSLGEGPEPISPLRCIKNNKINLCVTDWIVNNGDLYELHIRFSLEGMCYEGYIDDDLIIKEKPITREEFIRDMNNYGTYDSVVGKLLSRLIDKCTELYDIDEENEEEDE